MAITKSEGDPVVYMLAYGQFYAATVKATNGGDPPILVLEIEGKRVVSSVRYNASAQAPHTWCQYTDPGRPGTLPDPGLVIVANSAILTAGEADARYPAKSNVYTKTEADAAFLTQGEADDLYAPIT